MKETPASKEKPIPAKATHEEICNGALEHYRKISLTAHEWMNTVEKAIIFYRDNYNEVESYLERLCDDVIFKMKNIEIHGLEPRCDYCSNPTQGNSRFCCQVCAYLYGIELNAWMDKKEKER